jgi:SET domain-containing protein
LGLFAGRDLEKHTMVIEYIGELIRNEVANKREKLYEQQNRGIYMFRLDEEYVVDATMSGCLARYINHSCEVISSFFFPIRFIYFIHLAKFNCRSCTNRKR